MTSLFQKVFFRKKANLKHENRVYAAIHFDKTFDIPKKVLKLVGIVMAHGISEFRTKCWNKFYWFEILNVFLATLSELINIVLTILDAVGVHEAIEVFRMMPCLGSCVLSMFKSLKIKNNRAIFENLYYELREMWPRGEVNVDEHRIINSMLKQLNTIDKGYYWGNNVLLLIFMAPTFIDIIKRFLGYDTPFSLIFEYWVPFDPLKPYIFEVMVLLQTWHAIVVIWLNVSWDILFCTLLAHITMQFDLLSERIRRLIHVPVDQQILNSYPLAKISRECIQDEEEIIQSYADHDWEVRQHKELIDIVKRHHTLVRLAADMEAMFGFTLLVNFVYSSIMICFNGFCSVLIEKWNEVSYKGYLLITLSQTGLVCWYGQKLLDSSVGVSQALYECGWYNASRRIRRTILIMLMRAQKAVRVTTYGFSTVSLASYSMIIKTSWSYFTLLLNFFGNSSAGDSQ